MMMPANFSAIAETEMTYVVGGGLEAYLAPVMTASNWQTLNKNLITIIGNTYMSDLIKNTLGKVFSGTYYVSQASGAVWGKIATAYDTGKGAVNVDTEYDWVNKAAAGANGVLNGALSIVGNLAAIYTLGNGSVAGYHVDKTLTING